MTRKQSRPTRALGKAGYRRFEEVLEKANLVVQRVETENDIGRDAFVDIVEGTQVMGGVVCFQVKAGSSHFRHGMWTISGSGADFTLWRESSVPFFGAVFDPSDRAVRWVDLSHASRMLDERVGSVAVSGAYGRQAVIVPTENRLDVDVRPFLEAARVSLARRAPLPVTSLLAADPRTVEGAIVDIWAAGRHDPGSFLLLAALFRRLPPENRVLSIKILSLVSGNPDILWSDHNWVGERVRKAVRDQCRWEAADAAALLSEIGESGIARGTLGQAILHILELDRDVTRVLTETILDRSQNDSVRFWAASIVLYWAGDEAESVLDDLLATEDMRYGDGLLSTSRSLEEIDYFDYLTDSIAESGHIWLF